MIYAKSSPLIFNQDLEEEFEEEVPEEEIPETEEEEGEWEEELE